MREIVSILFFGLCLRIMYPFLLTFLISVLSAKFYYDFSLKIITGLNTVLQYKFY